MKKYIIGISAFYHDSSVCLFKDGQLIFACEEEKFSGIKHDSSYPQLTLDYIFKEFQINKKDIEAVCYYEDMQLKLQRVKKNIRPQIFKNLRFSIDSYLKIKSNIRTIRQKLEELSPNIFYSTHHESHLYYSFYTSDFKDAMCVSIDGVGELDTIAYGLPWKKGIKYLSVAQYPHSLGLYYSAMTAFLGFNPNEGEYKVMGLSSYGNPDKFIKRVKTLIKFENGKLICNMDVFTWNRSENSMFNEDLWKYVGMENRWPDTEITQDHMDLAAAIQLQYEEILFKIVEYLNDWYSSSNLCLGGGCAYNGLANGKIISNTKFEHIWIPPAPSDAGSSIGACIHYLVKNDKMKGRITRNPFLGPIYENWDIRKAVKGIKNCYKMDSDKDLIKDVAEFLNNGKVVGWYQGHMEFGARALGHRSILANPLLEGMKDRINKVIKRRERFRPFAPMVTKEKQFDYFEMTDDIPYMNQVVKVKSEYVDILKAITHVDGTARVQTVFTNTPMHDLLLEFERLTGYPILLNTSFNVKDKTIVRTPQDAIDMFNDTDMDILVMNNFVIYK